MLSRRNRVLVAVAVMLAAVGGFGNSASAAPLFVDDCEDQLLDEVECSTCNNGPQNTTHWFDENCCEGDAPCYMYPHTTTKEFSCAADHRPCTPLEEDQ